MEEWLGHPAVQAGALPFAVALVVAAALARTRFVALAQIAGFVACTTLAIGWSLESLTSTRKLVFVAVAVGLAGLVAQAQSPRRGRGVGGPLAFLPAGNFWVTWRGLAPKKARPAVGA